VTVPKGWRSLPQLDLALSRPPLASASLSLGFYKHTSACAEARVLRPPLSLSLSLALSLSFSLSTRAAAWAP